MPDLEVEAMGKIVDLLAALEEGARSNVLLYVNRRFGFNAASAGPAASGKRTPNGEGSGDEGDPAPPSDFKTFDELYDAANPQTQEEKALVGAYWAQECLQAEDFDSQAVNTGLKDLGHGISNITRALGVLESQNPVLVRQVKKAGTSQQARKRYKMTGAGTKRVQALLAAKPE